MFFSLKNSYYCRIIVICICILQTIEANPVKQSNSNKLDFELISYAEAGSAQNIDLPDAFISYRRASSKNLAMLVKVLMERENVSAYLDVENLLGGPWDHQLRNAITDSPNFILILGNGTLERAKGDENYSDFLHQEIKQAVDENKRIILVFDDYDFPNADDFSPEIQTALANQGLTWEHALVDQSLERLLSYMRRPVPFKDIKTVINLGKLPLRKYGG